MHACCTNVNANISMSAHDMKIYFMKIPWRLTIVIPDFPVTIDIILSCMCVSCISGENRYVYVVGRSWSLLFTMGGSEESTIIIIRPKVPDLENDRSRYQCPVTSCKAVLKGIGFFPSHLKKVHNIVINEVKNNTGRLIAIKGFLYFERFFLMSVRF